MNEPVETSELLAFSKIVESKSLSRAAEVLGVPRATISRRLARLEARLGARLLRRTTRSLVLTDAGETLYRHARIVLDAVHHAEASVRRADDSIRGDLRVSVPPLVTPSFFEMLCSFAEAHPDVRLTTHFSSRHVDLRRDGYDVAIRATAELEEGLVAKTLARAQMCAVASPAYLAQHGTPRTRDDLRRHRLLVGFSKNELPESHWPFGAGGKLHVEGSFFSNEILLLAEAAIRDLGIALLPLMVVRAPLEGGLLVHVLPEAIAIESRISVVYLEREFMPAHVRAFIDAVVAWAPEALDVEFPERCRESTRGRGKKRAASKVKRAAPKR